MSVVVNLDSNLTVIETITRGFISPTDSTLTFNQLNETASQFTSITSVPVTKQASFTKSLGSGLGTIDLTALPGLTADETVTFDGLRLQFAKFRNTSTNANSITIVKGASSGYTGFGSSFSLVLQPGQTVLFNLNEAGPDISSSVKTLDLTGTLVQTLDCQLAAG